MRLVLLLLGAATAWAAGAGTSLAADAVVWPNAEVPFAHGPGYYLSLWKMAPIWLLFATWVYTTDWINRDSLTLRLNYSFWNNDRHVFVLCRLSSGVARPLVLAVVSAAHHCLCHAADALRPRAK